MNMSQVIKRSAMSYPLWDIPISPTSLLDGLMVDSSMWKPRGSGTMMIDINICLSSNNNRNSTSVSYSSEQDNGLEKEAKQLTETYVKAMAEVFSKASLGSIPIPEESLKSGSQTKKEDDNVN